MTNDEKFKINFSDNHFQIIKSKSTYGEIIALAGPCTDAPASSNH